MKVILITGGATRLGRKISEHFIKSNEVLIGVKRPSPSDTDITENAGYKVIIHYNRSSEEATEMKSRYREVELVKCDFNKIDEVNKLFDTTEHIDVLINNASVFKNDSVETVTESSFAEHMNVNFLAPTILTKNFAAKFKRGHIINIVDSWAYDLPWNFISYVLSKNALRNFTSISSEALAPEIKVNAISLGFTLYNDIFSKYFFQQLQQKYPSNPELICRAIDFILLENLTGKIIDLCKWK
jgi:pteridine reductase